MATKSKTLKTTLLIFAGLLVLFVIFAAFSGNDDDQQHPASTESASTSRASKPSDEQAKKLDYSKPIFTDASTIVCPVGVMMAIDSDHSPEKLAEMFN